MLPLGPKQKDVQIYPIHVLAEHEMENLQRLEHKQQTTTICSISTVIHRVKLELESLS